MDTLKLSPHQSVFIREHRPDVFEVETIYGPDGDVPPAHYHPEQDEHFEVLEGTVNVRIDGEARTLGAGETIDILRGSRHCMWNADDSPARVQWQTRPAGRTEQWFRAIDGLHRTGQVRAGGTPGLLAFSVLLAEYRDTFRLAVAPDVVLRPLVRVLALAGRARGYNAHPSQEPTD